MKKVLIVLAVLAVVYFLFFRKNGTAAVIAPTPAPAPAPGAISLDIQSNTQNFEIVPSGGGDMTSRYSFLPI